MVSRDKTHFNLSVPMSRRCTSSTRSGAGRQRTTVPFSNCPDDSWSPPRNTIKSLSRLGGKSPLAHATLEDGGWNADREECQENIPNFEKSVGVPAGDVGQRVEVRHCR